MLTQGLPLSVKYYKHIPLIAGTLLVYHVYSCNKNLKWILEHRNRSNKSQYEDINSCICALIPLSGYYPETVLYNASILDCKGISHSFTPWLHPTVMATW